MTRPLPDPTETHYLECACSSFGHILCVTIDPGDERFSRTPTGRVRRGEGVAREAYDSELRRLWRALALVIRAKLEAVESGISTLDREFMADVVTRDGRTLGEAILPHLAEGLDPSRLLPALGDS